MRKTLGALMLLASVAAASAQNYPSRDIKMIVPFPAGGPSDIVARIAADGMSKQLGHNIIVENVGGAGGTLGSRAPPKRAGRLHHSRRQHGLVHRRAVLLSKPQIRHQGLRADRHVGQRAGRDFDQPSSAGDQPQGIRRLGQGERRRRQAGAWRPRRHRAYGVSDVQPDGGHQPDNGRLSRHGPGHERPDGRARRHGLRAGRRDGGGDSGQQGQGPGRRRPVASCGAARHADLEGGRPAGVSAQHLERRFRAEGHAEGHRRQARGRARQGARRSATAERLGKLGGAVPPKAERGPDFLRKGIATEVTRWSPILKEAAATAKPN